MDPIHRESGTLNSIVDNYFSINGSLVQELHECKICGKLVIFISNEAYHMFDKDSEVNQDCIQNLKTFNAK